MVAFWEAGDVAEVVIPAKLARVVVAWEGDSGRKWLERLPSLVAELASEWDLELDDPFEPGGNISWVAPARRRSDGVEGVLKLQHPHPESAPEAAALAAWDGDGAVRLFADDPRRHALLIECCRPGHPLGDEPDPLVVARVGAAIGARLHAVPPPAGLPTLASVLRTWADEVEGRLEAHAWPDPGLARRALETMRHRPDACAHPVLLHGDLNPTNLLAATREPWLAIDPKPMVGDPAHDGPRLVTQPDPLVEPDPAAVVARRLALVADGLSVERDALLEWCLVDSIEIGTSGAAHGDTETAERCRGHVELIAPHLP